MSPLNGFYDILAQAHFCNDDIINCVKGKGVQSKSDHCMYCGPQLSCQ